MGYLNFDEKQIITFFIPVLLISYILLSPILLELTIPYMKNADSVEECEMVSLSSVEEDFTSVNSNFRFLYVFLDFPASAKEEISERFDRSIFTTEPSQPNELKLKNGSCSKGPVEPPTIDDRNKSAS